ncbi:MAG: YcxB family protein [Oscillospiraceae bacterium]|nr:YcxB family protein [Oscillospiraceae bacterium]
MEFEFHVSLNDQDYLDYNIFCMMQSHNGKKQLKTFQILFTIIAAIVIFMLLFVDDLSQEAVLTNMVVVILSLLVVIFLPKIFTTSLKRSIKSMKKSGKLAYEPESTLQFSEDSFIDISLDSKSEIKYSAIERISIVDNKTIYLHINSVQASILPLSCFESEEQYRAFYEFIKTKCANIDLWLNNKCCTIQGEPMKKSRKMKKL